MGLTMAFNVGMSSKEFYLRLQRRNRFRLVACAVEREDLGRRKWDLL